MPVLHAHLPFVRHPEYNDSFEERWLFEAILECYLPLLIMFERLENDKIPYSLTLSLSPTLVSMLLDPTLQQRFLDYIHRLIELAEKEIVFTASTPFADTARMYKERFIQLENLYLDKYKCNLVSAFKEFGKSENLEILTCCATHGFLPLLGVHPPCVRAQIEIALLSHEKNFNRRPAGIWLPECGFSLGHDRFLAKAGIRYFFLESHGILKAKPASPYGIFAPIVTPNGVVAFGRENVSSAEVWSSEIGYPGDPDYREFYRDVGFDRDLEYIKPYIHESGIRVNTGIKYYRVTDRKIALGQKEPYSHSDAWKKTQLNAVDFIEKRQKQVQEAYKSLGIIPLVVSSYDAELFGHWWYEGPIFLENIFRHLKDQDIVKPMTPSRYLESHTTLEVAQPLPSTWGEKGHNEYWVHESNNWVWRHIHAASAKMISMADKYKDKDLDPLFRRSLNQLGRELLLAQSSDWPFILRNGTTIEYANFRIKEHIGRFNQIIAGLEKGEPSLKLIELLENRHNIFPDLDFKIFCSESPIKLQEEISSP